MGADNSVFEIGLAKQIALGGYFIICKGGCFLRFSILCFEFNINFDAFGKGDWTGFYNNWK